MLLYNCRFLACFHSEIDTRFQIKKKKRTLNLLSYKDYEETIIEKFSKKNMC